MKENQDQGVSERDKTVSIQSIVSSRVGVTDSRHAQIFYTGRMTKVMQTVHKIRKVQMQMMQQIWNAREII